MKAFKIILLFATVGIYTLTVIAINNNGINWPAVAIEDLLSLNWRSQFDFDFIVYLLIFAIWIIWREGGTTKAYIFGSLSIVMGGMFGFPYLIYVITIARGDPKIVLLGMHAKD